MHTGFTQKCYEFNQIAGKADLVSIQDFKFQLKLIQEEVKELEVALDKEDIVETLDAGVDILVTTIGLMQKLQYMGIDVFEACDKTADNNLTKFPMLAEGSEEVIMKTIEMYKEQGKTVTFFTLGSHVVFKDENDKVMKPYGYVKNDLTELCYNPDGTLIKFGETKTEAEGE